MALVPLLKFLDVRPRSKAEVNPVVNSVNIPVDELKERLSELPKERVFLADTPGYSEAKAILESGGRTVEVCAASYSRSPVIKKKKATGRLWSPSDYVVERVSGLKPGVCLDLGCGVGRDTSYLAAEGWQVVAIDNLARTIGRAKKFVSFYSEPNQVTFLIQDCVDDMPAGTYDLVLSMMLFSSKLPEQIADRLRPNGKWILEAYTKAYQAESGHPNSPDKAVSVSQLESLTMFEVQDIQEVGNRLLATLTKK